MSDINIPGDDAITGSPPPADNVPSIVKEYHHSFLQIFAFGIVWTAAVVAAFLLFLVFS